MMMKADGFDAACIGVGSRCGAEEVLVYDIDKAVEILMKRDGMDVISAYEYIEFNCVGAYVGEQTPIWVRPLDGELDAG